MEGIWEKFDRIIDEKANCQPVLDIWLNILSDSQSCQNLFNYSFWFQELDDVYHNVSAVVAETLIQAADVSALKVKSSLRGLQRPPSSLLSTPSVAT